MVLQILILNVSHLSFNSDFLFNETIENLINDTLRQLHSYSLTRKSDKKVKFLNYVNFGFCDLKFTLKLIDELCLIFCCISDLSVFSALILN